MRHLVFVLVMLIDSSASAAEVLVEAEGFADLGGQVTYDHDNEGGLTHFWAYGQYLDPFQDAEEIRDHLFCAIYGTFYTAKRLNPDAHANLELERVGHVPAGGESRRLNGKLLEVSRSLHGNGGPCFWITPTGDRVESFAFHPNRKMAVVTCLAKFNAGIAVLDIQSSPPRVLSYLDTGGGPQGIEFTPDGDKLFVGSTVTNRIDVFDVVGDFTLRKDPRFLKTGHGHCSLTIGKTWQE